MRSCCRQKRSPWILTIRRKTDSRRGARTSVQSDWVPLLIPAQSCERIHAKLEFGDPQDRDGGASKTSEERSLIIRMADVRLRRERLAKHQEPTSWNLGRSAEPEAECRLLGIRDRMREGQRKKAKPVRADIPVCPSDSQAQLGAFQVLRFDT